MQTKKKKKTYENNPEINGRDPSAPPTGEAAEGLTGQSRDIIESWVSSDAEADRKKVNLQLYVSIY